MALFSCLIRRGRLRFMRFVLPAILALAAIGLAPAAAAVAQPTRQVPVDSLIYDLRNPDPVRRREAVVLIGQNKVQRAVTDVVAIAGDPDVSVRRAIVSTLQALDDIRSLPGLVALTSDPEKDIRESAVTGVTRLYLPRESGIGPSLTRVVNFFNPNSDEWADVVIDHDLPVDASVIPALQARLSDPSDSIRVKSARSIGILRGRVAVPMLVLVMKEDRNPSVRFEAIRAIGKIGDTTAAKDVLPFTLSTDSKLRTEAALALGRLHDKAALPELTRLFMKEAALQKRQADGAFRSALLEAIALIADPSSKELFTRQRAHDDAAVRVQAYAGLARVGDASLTTAVSQDRLSETDVQVQTAQAFALYRFGRKEYLEELVKALGSRRTSARAREYLLELRQDEVADLGALSRLEDPGLRESIAEILGLIGDDRARPVLQDLTRDTRGQVAPLATQALERIAARSGGSAAPR
jgi:HEAT repeat protein